MLLKKSVAGIVQMIWYYLEGPATGVLKNMVMILRK
ncbi:MAG: hypothetical protein ACJAW3_001407 [Lentimonas sp.]|jgi:hypothetical protein